MVVYIMKENKDEKNWILVVLHVDRAEYVLHASHMCINYQILKSVRCNNVRERVLRLR